MIETEAEYRARQQQYKRAAYVRRKAKGLCVGCRAPICSQRSGTSCASCLDKQRVERASSYQRKRSSGQCLTCGNRSAKFIHCLPCRMTANAKRRSRRALKRKDVLIQSEEAENERSEKTI